MPPKQAARHNMNPLERGISHLAEIFVPLLPAIITGGLILGFRNVIGDIKMFDDRTHTLVEISQFWAQVHAFLWLLGEAIFHFLPVGVCWSAVKKMGGSGSSGIVLGITLVSPQLMNAYGIGQQTPEVWTSACSSSRRWAIRPRSFRPCWRVSSWPGWRPTSSASFRPTSTW